MKTVTAGFLYAKSRLLKIQLQIYLIPFLLFDSQISFCNLIGGVVVQIHQHGGRRPLLPCVIAKGFAQRMTADVFGQAAFLCGLFNNPVGLIAGEGLRFTAGAGKKVIRFFSVF